MDASGVLYIADTDHNRVLKLTTSGAITTVAGTGAFDSAGDGGARNRGIHEAALWLGI